MQLEDEAGKEAKDESDLELDPAETTRWGAGKQRGETTMRMHGFHSLLLMPEILHQLIDRLSLY